MDDNQKPSPERPDPPANPSKPSKGFTGKPPKKGRLTRKKGARRRLPVPQEDAVERSTGSPAPQVDDGDDGEPAPPLPAASSSSSLRSRIEMRGAKRKISNQEYESELKRVYAEIDSSHRSLEQKDSEIAALKKRNINLTSQFARASDTVRASRTAAREAHSCDLSIEAINTPRTKFRWAKISKLWYFLHKI